MGKSMLVTVSMSPLSVSVAELIRPRWLAVAPIHNTLPNRAATEPARRNSITGRALLAHVGRTLTNEYTTSTPAAAKYPARAMGGPHRSASSPPTAAALGLPIS